MIEEIQALMPILDKISEGALWAFIVYMTVNTISILVWPMCLVVVLLKGFNLVLKSCADSVDTIKVTRLGGTEITYLGTLSTFKDLLLQMSNGHKYLHDSEVSAAIAKLKK